MSEFSVINNKLDRIISILTNDPNPSDPPTPPPTPPPSNVETVRFDGNGIAYIKSFSMVGGSTKLYRFKSPAYDYSPLTVRVMEASQYGHGVIELLAKYAGRNCDLSFPTTEDFSAIRRKAKCPSPLTACSPRWDKTNKSWRTVIYTPTTTTRHPNKYKGDYYYCMNGNLISGIYLYRENVSGDHWWYVLLKNTSNEYRRDIDLMICKPRS